MASFDEFVKFDIRVGEIKEAQELEGARKPTYKMWVDFGPELGEKTAAARITANYSAGDLEGRQVLGVVNFEPKLVAGFSSEVLLLGVYSDSGDVLVQPERPVKNGAKVG